MHFEIYKYLVAVFFQNVHSNLYMDFIEKFDFP